MAAAFRSVGTAVEANSTSVTCAYTLTAGDLLGCLIGHIQDASPDSVVWNGSEGMTKVDTNAAVGVRNASVYLLAGATAGTANIVVTFAASNFCAAQGFGYSGVDSGTPFDGAANGSAADANPTLTMTSPVGDLALLGIIHSTAGTDITMSNGTKQSYIETANWGFIVCDRAGADSTQINGTITGETNWSAVGCNLNAAAVVLAGPLIGGRLVGGMLIGGRLVR